MKKLVVILMILQLCFVLPVHAANGTLDMGKYGNYAVYEGTEDIQIKKELPYGYPMLYLTFVPIETESPFYYGVTLYDLTTKIALAHKSNLSGEVCIRYDIAPELAGHLIGIRIEAETGMGYIYTQLSADFKEKESNFFDEIIDVDYMANKYSTWAEEYISHAERMNIINERTKYFYTLPINRQFFCEILYSMITNIQDIDIVLTNHQFEDIDIVSINALYSIGIVNGKNEYIFAPNDSISREEAATILGRTADYLNISSNDDQLIKYNDDSDISDWAKDSVYKVAALKIMNDVENNYFYPMEEYTKEQAITTIMRLYNLSSKN